MSLLPPEVHTALSQLLRALSTPDNAVRSQAEDQLNNEWVQNKPDVLLMGLAEQIGGAEDTLVSSLSPFTLSKGGGGGPANDHKTTQRWEKIRTRAMRDWHLLRDTGPTE
jgi:hypothetical protein